MSGLTTAAEVSWFRRPDSGRLPEVDSVSTGVDERADGHWPAANRRLHAGRSSDNARQAVTGRSPLQHRSPAAVLFFGLAAGILLDDQLCLAPVVWISAGVVAALASFGLLASNRWLKFNAASTVLPKASRTDGSKHAALSSRSRNTAAARVVRIGMAWCGFLAVVLAGAGRHALCTYALAPQEVGLFASETATPVRIRGTITSRPVVVLPIPDTFPAAIPDQERTLLQIHCDQLGDSSNPTVVTGNVRVDVRGRCDQFRRGDRVQIVGRWSRTAAPANPGAFDFRRWLRHRDIHVILRCDTPECVQPDPDRTAVSNPLNRIFAAQESLRQQSLLICKTHLDDRVAALAASLLLGIRTEIPPSVRDAFAETGMMHVLAISGANVAVVAALFWSVCVLLPIGRRGRTSILAAGLMLFGAITEPEPPVLRALLMAAMLVVAHLQQKPISLVNVLSLAAIALLLVKPTDLFDPGAQLSFLAILALGWSGVAIDIANGFVETLRDILSRIVGARVAVNTAPNALIKTPLPVNTVIHMATATAQMIWQATIVTATVWLFTLPIALASFHTVAIAGFFANVLLAPLVAVVMWSGYLFLILGLIYSPLATPVAVVFNPALSLLVDLLDTASNVAGGPTTVAGPLPGWIVVYYAGLWILVSSTRGSRVFRYTAMALVVWVSAGILGIEPPARSPGLRCCVLDVGHGLAVLVQCPNGKTILYDAGRLQNGRQAARVVHGALWYNRRRSADAIIVSHADLDHFNALPTLLEDAAVSTVLLHPAFYKSQQSSAKHLLQRLAAANVPIQTVWADDELLLDPTVSFRVLHPPADRSFSNDNASSLILSIEYAGHRILLTGDIEDDGMTALLNTPCDSVDVLLSPHHGGVRSNTTELAAWAKPRCVIASCGYQSILPRLQNVFGEECRVLTTEDHAAVQIDISPTGVQTIRHWKPEAQ